MKKWSLRILAALLTFALGLGAAAIVRFRLASVAKVETIVVGANIQAQHPPTQIAEDAQPTGEVDDDAQPSHETYEPIKPRPVSISPYELKRLIDKNEQTEDSFDLRPIWKKLGIEMDVDEPFASCDNCAHCCEAKIYSLNNEGGQDNEVLFALDFGEPSATLYLIFKEIGTQHNGRARWNLLGLIPYSYGAPFIAPSYRVVTAGKQRWLAIEYIAGHGAGYGLDFEDWYEISERGMPQVLTYQTGLFACCSSPEIDSRTKILKINSKDGAATVTLQFANSFEIDPSNERFPLWRTRRKVTYIKRRGTSKFVLDPLNSEMTGKELYALSHVYFDDDGDYLKDILKYNYRELASIAAGRDTKRKEWLRDFLNTCNDSPEKQSLQKLLEGARP